MPTVLPVGPNEASACGAPLMGSLLVVLLLVGVSRLVFSTGQTRKNVLEIPGFIRYYRANSRARARAGTNSLPGHGGSSCGTGKTTSAMSGVPAGPGAVPRLSSSSAANPGAQSASLLSSVEPPAGDVPEVIESCLAYCPPETPQQRCLPLVCRFNPTGTLLGAGYANGDFVVWEACTREACAVFRTRGLAASADARASDDVGAAVVAACWSGNGRKLMVATADMRAVVFDVIHGRLEQRIQFPGHIRSIEIHPKRAGLCLVSFFRREPALIALRPKPDGTHWVQTLRATALGASSTSAHVHATFASRGERVVASGSVGTSTEYVLLPAGAQPRCQARVEIKGKGSRYPFVKEVRVCARTGAIALNCSDATIRLWPGGLPGPAANNGPAHLLRAEGRQFNRVRFTANGKWVVASLNKPKDTHQLALWDATTGRLANVLKGPSIAGPVLGFDAHPRRQYLITAAQTHRNVYLWAPYFAKDWKALGPTFEELLDNEEYVEKEDEFDSCAVTQGAESRSSGASGATLKTRESEGSAASTPQFSIVDEVAPVGSTSAQGAERQTFICTVPFEPSTDGLPSLLRLPAVCLPDGQADTLRMVKEQEPMPISRVEISRRTGPAALNKMIRSRTLALLQKRESKAQEAKVEQIQDAKTVTSGETAKTVTSGETAKTVTSGQAPESRAAPPALAPSGDEAGRKRKREAIAPVPRPADSTAAPPALAKIEGEEGQAAAKRVKV